MEEKTDAQATPGQRPSTEPNPTARPVSDENTTAFDPSTKSEDTSAGHLPVSEPLVAEADHQTPLRDKSLSFLQPSTQPGSLGRLGHYEVLEVLGQGGFGIVLKACDEKLQRLVAIKVLGPQLARNPTARSRFVREARAVAAVNSKYVVSTYAVEEQPVPYLVMEYVAGKTLQDRINQLGPLDTRDILRIGAEIAEGLAAAHQRGLIHRDIKPANILLEEKENSERMADEVHEGDGPTVSLSFHHSSFPRVKIADFGLARAVDDATLTQSGVIAGTPKYMSPEQARGETLDHRSDLFSLGSVLYTMCTGQAPFRADRTLGVLKRVCDDTPQPIREINSEIPRSLAALVKKLHVKDPVGRFQTAAEVAELLRQHLAHQDDPARPFPSGAIVDSETTDLPAYVPTRMKTVSASTPRPRRWKWVATATVLLPVLALAVTEITGVTHLFHSSSTKTESEPASQIAQQAPPPVIGSGDPVAAKKPLTSEEQKQREQEAAAKLKTEQNPLNNAVVGDWAEYRLTQSRDGQNIEGTIRMEVTAKTASTVRLKDSITVLGERGGGPEREVDLTKPYDPTNVANLPREANAKVEKLGSGDEKLQLGAKEYETSWTQLKVTGTGNAGVVELTAKYWTSRIAPLGGLVKMEQTLLVIKGSMRTHVRTTLEFTRSGSTADQRAGESHAARGDWSAAVASYARALAAQPLEDGHLGFEYACVLLLAGDEPGYRKLCALMLERGGQPGVRHYHVARACTLATDSVKDAALPGKLADDELRRHNHESFSLTEQGALAYRAGQYDNAATLLEQSLEADSRPGYAVLNWLWLSMVEQRRGKPVQARVWLEKARKWVEQHPSIPVVPDDSTGLHLHNWLEAQVLYREARRANQPEIAPPPREKM